MDSLKKANFHIIAVPTPINTIKNPDLNLITSATINIAKIIKNGDIVTVGQLSLEILYTPGHYNDSVCYLLDGILFTGDTLFVGRTGRTISKGSNTKDLYKSIYDIILNLPHETIIYPGHDYGPKMCISIGQNISLSPLLQANDEDDFIKRMDDYEANRTIGS